MEVPWLSSPTHVGTLIGSIQGMRKYDSRLEEENVTQNISISMIVVCTSETCFQKKEGTGIMNVIWAS